MEQKRKQRLAGALVLSAAAVIVYPLFFGRDMPTEERAVKIPEPPPVPDVPEYVDVLETPMEVPVPPADYETPPPAVSDRPALDEQGVPVSWTLQLAAFSRQENAEQLQNKLRTAGYRSYTREGSANSGKRLYRVYVGPDLRRDRILEVQQELEKQFRLKGLAVRFRP